MVAQAGADLPPASPPQETDGGIAQQGQKGTPFEKMPGNEQDAFLTRLQNGTDDLETAWLPVLSGLVRHLEHGSSPRPTR